MCSAATRLHPDVSQEPVQGLAMAEVQAPPSSHHCMLKKYVKAPMQTVTSAEHPWPSAGRPLARHPYVSTAHSSEHDKTWAKGGQTSPAPQSWMLPCHKSMRAGWSWQRCRTYQLCLEICAAVQQR